MPRIRDYRPSQGLKVGWHNEQRDGLLSSLRLCRRQRVHEAITSKKRSFCDIQYRIACNWFSFPFSYIRAASTSIHSVTNLLGTQRLNLSVKDLKTIRLLLPFQSESLSLFIHNLSPNQKPMKLNNLSSSRKLPIAGRQCLGSMTTSLSRLYSSQSIQTEEIIGILKYSKGRLWILPQGLVQDDFDNSDCQRFPRLLDVER